MRHLLLKVFLITSLIFFLPSIALSKSIHVPTDYPTIKDAIAAAVAGDRIIVAPGVYFEVIDIQKPIEIVSEEGPHQTIIDGSQSRSVVRFIYAKSDLTHTPMLSGFTIRNGYSQEGQGGGITIYNSDAIIEDNIIIDNEAMIAGGAILIEHYANATVRNNTITSNSTTRSGGAIVIMDNSHPLLYNNTIEDNIVSGPVFYMGGASGGAIFVDGYSSPQIIGNTIRHNVADFAGGAICLRVGGSPIIEDNIISYNEAAYGGGIHVEAEGGTPTIRNNTIANNKAIFRQIFPGSGFGGGISIYNNSRPFVVGNEIAHNFASSGGGGIVNSEDAYSVIQGNHIHNNEVTITSGNHTGGGIYVAESEIIAYNNVIHNNKARIGAGIGMLDDTIATIYNNTIVNNSAAFDPNRPSGGGIFVREHVKSVNIFNNIITQNDDYQIFEEFSRAIINNNLLNNDNLGIYFNWNLGPVTSISWLNNSDSISATGNLTGYEGFLDPLNNNYRINANSTARSNSDIPVLSIYDHDYFFRELNGKADLGAFQHSLITQKPNPIYRFWSDLYSKHFYTISKTERNTVLNNYPVRTWRYEGVVFRAYNVDQPIGINVHRFWSNTYKGHFYTINDEERQHIIENYPTYVWQYEGEAYNAKNSASDTTTELYRFWSDTYKGHFYTANITERDNVIKTYPEHIWKYEGIGFYVNPAD